MKFKDMDEVRQKQVLEQVDEFEKRFENVEGDCDYTNIAITPEFTLENYAIHRDTFQSDQMTAVKFARWLKSNNKEYLGKHVIDMCCGGGVQGIVALQNGAKHVTFVDYSKKACENTLQNLAQYGLEDNATVIQSDLFRNIKIKADLIIINPPFFPCEPIEGKPISRTMCMPTEKLEEFYDQAKRYAPKIAACHWDFAGKENDPKTLGLKFGWNVERRFFLPTGYGLQQGSEEHYFKVDLLERK